MPKKTNFSIADDMDLREYGFTILRRRPSEEPVWKRGDRILTQSQAMKVIRGERRLVEDLKKV